MLKYYISMILFLNLGHGISIRKCEYFGSMGLCLPWRQLEFVQWWWQKETWTTSIRTVYCSHVSSCHDLSIVVCLFRLLFWESAKLSKRLIFKYLLNRVRDDSLENRGMQAGADGLCMISILVTFSRCCVVLLCGNNLWHIEEFEVKLLWWIIHVLEETKMHCSSETVVPIWDFECESALPNLGFSRSFKVSRFVNILFLPLIFWNKSLILFFLDFFSFWRVAAIYGGWVCSGFLLFLWGFGFWSAKLKQWETCELQFGGRPPWLTGGCSM